MNINIVGVNQSNNCAKRSNFNKRETSFCANPKEIFAALPKSGELTNLTQAEIAIAKVAADICTKMGTIIPKNFKYVHKLNGENVIPKILSEAQPKGIKFSELADYLKESHNGKQRSEILSSALKKMQIAESDTIEIFSSH